MNRYSKKRICVLTVLITLTLVINSTAMASITQTLDSSTFGYRYEFDALPSEVDLDNNGTNDFTLYGSGTLADGIFSMETLSGTQGYLWSSGSEEIWAQSGITFATGYTMEVCVRVNSTDANSSHGSAYLQVATSDNNAVGWLNLHDANQSWGYSGSYFLSCGTNDNSDGFHIFRIAQEPSSSSYSIWRDGVLLCEEIGPGFSGVYNHLVLGDKSGSILGGSIDYDYLRFTAGAYAPASVPEPSTIMLILAIAGVIFFRRQK